MPPHRNLISRVARALLVLGATLLLATGCVKVDFNVTISEEGTVSGEYVVAVSEAVMNDLGDFGDSADPFESSTNPFGDKGTVEDYTEDIDGETYVGKRYTVTDVPIDELTADMGGSDEGLSIVRSGGDYIVTFVMSDDDIERYPGLTAELADEITFTISVTFPGRISESNGELSNSGRTVTWVLDLTKENQLRAVGSATDSLPTWLWFVVGGGVLGVGAIVAVILIARRRTAPAGVIAPSYPGQQPYPAQDGGYAQQQPFPQQVSPADQWTPQPDPNAHGLMPPDPHSPFGSTPPGQWPSDPQSPPPANQPNPWAPPPQS